MCVQLRRLSLFAHIISTLANTAQWLVSLQHGAEAKTLLTFCIGLHGGETRITFSPSCTIKVSPFQPPQQSEGNCLIFVSSDTSSRTWKADPNAWKQTVKIRKVGKGSDVESITSFCLGFYSPLCSAACRWPKLPAVLRSVRCLVSLPKKSSCPFTCQCVRPCLRECVCACVSGEVEMKSPGCPLQSPATS